jgi:hypothetical protein
MKKMNKTYRLGEIVYIEWDDHCTHNNSWVGVDKVFHNVCKVKTVGFVVKDGGFAITVSLMMQKPNDVASQCLTIIKSCINKIKVLK